MKKIRRARRKRKITETEVMAWAEKHPLVKTWLAKVQQPEHRGYLFAMFCNWSGLSPEELYALKDDPKSLDAEYLLDNFVADKEAPFTKSIKWGVIQAVKSFFSHNYRDLAKKSGEIIVPRKRPVRKPTKEELMKLWKACYTPRDRALITFVNSTAIAKVTLDLLTWNDFEEGWEGQEIPCVIVPSEKLKGHGIGKWRGVKQITFLTPEAKEALIEYKEWIEERMGRKLSQDDYVWLDVYAPYEPLSHTGLGMLIWKLAKRAGVKFSWHDARRYVETALEETKINPNWARKIRGRKVRGEEAPYSQPAIEQLRAAYREAVPMLQFLSKTPTLSEEDLRIKLHLDSLRGRIPSQVIDDLERKYLGKEPRTAIPQISLEAEAIQRIADREGINLMEGAYLISKDAIEIEMEEIRKERMRRQNSANRQNCQNGNCQRIVAEKELPPLLAKGWHVAAVLPSGKVVISNT